MMFVTLTDLPIRRNNRARRVSTVMQFLCVAFTVFILLILALVTGYLVFSGIGSVSFDFFTRLPRPYGQAGFPGGDA